MISAQIVVGAAVSAITSFAIAGLVRKIGGRLGLVDRPNARSSHVRPTPRGGGLGIVAGSCVGLLLAAAGDWDAATWTVLFGAMLVAGLGLVDDIRGLSPRLRFLGQTCAAAFVVASTGPS